MSNPYNEEFSKTKKEIVAGHLQITPQTLSNWIRRGLPMHDFDEFCKWVQVNKSNNAKVLKAMANYKQRVRRDKKKAEVEAEVKNQERDETESEIIFTTGDDIGAEFALQRMSKLEITIAKKLEQAIKDNDVILMEMLQKQYREVANTLRQMDSSLAKDRRDAGETINKNEMELISSRVGLADCLAEERFLDAFAVVAAGLDCPKEIRQAAKQLFYDCKTQAYNELLGDEQIPQWWVDAFQKGQGV